MGHARRLQQARGLGEAEQIAHPAHDLAFDLDADVVADAGAHRSARARAVAMSIEDRRTPEWRARAASLDSGRLQYLTERRLREYSPADIGQLAVYLATATNVTGQAINVDGGMYRFVH